jgi:hypothetical protein
MLLSAFAILPVAAQAPAPQVYSVNALSMMTPASFAGGAADLMIYRRGSKEFVNATVASTTANPQGSRTSNFFDLTAHKVYMQDLTRNTCSWMRYVSDEMPNYDPLAISPATRQEMANAKPTIIGRESVNGIPAKIEEAETQPGQPKARMWMAEKGDYPVKVEMAGPDGKPMTLLEVKKVSYTAPPENFFVPPSNCDTQAQGEMSSTGFSGHAEFSIEAHGSGSTDLKTGETHGEASAQMTVATPPPGHPKRPPVRAPHMGATEPNAQYRVTDVRLHLVPESYSGPCPGHVQLVGEITTNGPGTVWYRFLAGAVSHSPEGTIVFTAGGTKTVSIQGTFRETPRVPETAMLAIMEDQAGNHGPLTLSSGDVDYNITCTGQAAPGH